LLWDFVFHPDVYAERREKSSRRRGECWDLQLLSGLRMDYLVVSMHHSAVSKAKAEELDKAACLAALKG
jgi:hypothetical protein